MNGRMKAQNGGFLLQLRPGVDNADAKKGKGEGGLHGRKVKGFRRVIQKKGRSLRMQL